MLGKESAPPDGPKLAIVIACWNYAEYVGRAIRSASSQSGPHCEILVVDDGSTDGSWEAIEASGVPAIRIPNGGQRAACLHALDRTRAPFILFLDADDELKPGAVETILRHLDPGVAKLQFSLQRIDAEGASLGGAPLPAYRAGPVLAEQVLRTGVYRTPPTSGNVFRRDLCELLREADYDRAVDGVILFAAPFLGDVVSLPDELALYRIHGRNDSGLGRMPEPKALLRDMRRFADRMAHLRTFLRGFGLAEALVRTEDAYFHRERRLWLDIVSGRRPKPGDIRKLLAALRRDSQPLRVRAALALFAISAALLPNAGARALLARRAGGGQGGVSAAIRSLAQA